MTVHARTLLAATSVALLVSGLAACAPQDEAPTTAVTPTSVEACTKDQLKTLKAGTFTIGTDKPAYEPWFSDNDPTNGKGYESAVAYAVAQKLGFAKSEVTWKVVPFTNAYAPGDKPFDIDINQVSISPAREGAVDFSSGYYDVAQAIVSTKGSKIAGAKSIAELKDAKLGAQVGTTSYTAINEQIQPTQKAAVYDTNDLAVQALKNGQIDGIVVDLPTAFSIIAVQVHDGVLVGQLPPGGGKPDQFGIVLVKGSALTACVSQAVDALKGDGTLTTLESQWLSNTDGAPKLS